MSLFHRKLPAAANLAGLGEGFPYREGPAWIREGIEPYLLGGRKSLDVVGESFRQNELQILTGYHPGGERVHGVKIRAVLVAENGNPADPDAVAVWIKDPHAGYLLVGYLSRENARLYRPGLLAQERSLGRPIALAGVITGGGMRADGPGMLGVFLRHNPAHFTPELAPLGLLPTRKAARPRESCVVCGTEPVRHAGDTCPDCRQAARKAATTELQQRVLECRERGMTWKEIAAVCGLSGPGAAHNVAYPPWGRYKDPAEDRRASQEEPESAFWWTTVRAIRDPRRGAAR
jgi:hypothetical protein